MCCASALFYFIFYLLDFQFAQIQSCPEVTDCKCGETLAFFVPFTQVTVHKLHGTHFLLLFFLPMDLWLNVLGLLLGLVGCLDFCASSLLHPSRKPLGPVLFISVTCVWSKSIWSFHVDDPVTSVPHQPQLMLNWERREYPTPGTNRKCTSLSCEISAATS